AAPSATGEPAATTTAPALTGATASITAATPSPAGWLIRSVDTMKLSRDTLKAQLSDRQIAAVVALDARLHLTHITVGVYYDDPAYMARCVRAIRAVGLHVWFRAHWYAWENHRTSVVVHGQGRTVVVSGTMTTDDYIVATRFFLQTHSNLLRN